ncbi:MAG TPA: hypothetical protein VE570_01835 [Thermoleophilaceae bacterium]|nr:hypothetical protein [Thermoleophilaceae bacterium]
MTGRLLRLQSIGRQTAALEPAKLDRRFARRAKRLTKTRTRKKFASGVERAVAAADDRRRRVFTAAVPVRRQTVHACRAELLALATRLRAPEPVYAQGVALVSELLGNSGSPLYRDGGDLRKAVWAALAALDGVWLPPC